MERVESGLVLSLSLHEVEMESVFLKNACMKDMSTFMVLYEVERESGARS